MAVETYRKLFTMISLAWASFIVFTALCAVVPHNIETNLPILRYFVDNGFILWRTRLQYVVKRHNQNIFAVVIHVSNAGTECFLYHWKEVLVLIMVLQLSLFVKDNRWITLYDRIVTATGFLRKYYSYDEYDNDSEPPALEDCSSVDENYSYCDGPVTDEDVTSSVKHNVGDFLNTGSIVATAVTSVDKKLFGSPPTGWHVFDHVFGVIPQETRDLWEQQEEESIRRRNHLMCQLQTKKTSMPPIRFSCKNSSINADISSVSNIIRPRSRSNTAILIDDSDSDGDDINDGISF